MPKHRKHRNSTRSSRHDACRDKTRNGLLLGRRCKMNKIAATIEIALTLAIVVMGAATYIDRHKIYTLVTHEQVLYKEINNIKIGGSTSTVVQFYSKEGCLAHKAKLYTKSKISFDSLTQGAYASVLVDAECFDSTTGKGEVIQ